MHDAIQSRNKKRQLEKMCNVLLCMIGRSCSLYISQNSKTPEVRSRAAQRHSPYRASAADTWADKDAVDRLFAVLCDVGIRFAPPAKMGYRHTCIRIIFSPPILKIHMSADAYSVICCIFTFFSSKGSGCQEEEEGCQEGREEGQEEGRREGKEAEEGCQGEGQEAEEGREEEGQGTEEEGCQGEEEGEEGRQEGEEEGRREGKEGQEGCQEGRKEGEEGREEGDQEGCCEGKEGQKGRRQEAKGQGQARREEGCCQEARR